MSCLRHVLLSASLAFALTSCRASFEDIQKMSLSSNGENLEAKSDDARPKPTDEAPLLENTKDLPPEDSDAYGCDGTVIINEKGRDRNRDGILQPTEVTEIASDCKAKPKDTTDPKGEGKDPGSDGKDPGTPTGSTKCPDQNAPKGKCPNDPDQNNPGQS